VDNVRWLSPASSGRQDETGDRSWGDLLASCARGDEAAFADLYDGSAARIYGIVLRVVRDPAQAAEVTQDVYLQIWRESSRYDAARGSALSWLLTIAHRRAVDRVRAAQSSTVREDRYVSMQSERAYDEVSEKAQLRVEYQRVRKVMHQLTDPQRRGVALLQRRRHRPSRAQHREVGEHVAAHHVRAHLGAVGELCLDLLRAAEDVRAGQQEAVGGQHARAARSGAARRLHAQARHARQYSIGHRRDHRRVGVQGIVIRSHAPKNARAPL
jgi:RNA polymerase sigma-70 factor (ECF subfamily)